MSALRLAARRALSETKKRLSTGGYELSVGAGGRPQAASRSRCAICGARIVCSLGGAPPVRRRRALVSVSHVTIASRDPRGYPWENPPDEI